MHWANWPDGVAYAALLLLTGLASRTDLKTGKVLNALTYPAALGGLAFWVVVGLTHTSPLGKTGLDAGVALCAALLPFAILKTMGGLGWGDVKLMAAVGAVSGDWRVVFHTAVFAFIAAFVVGVVVMVRKGLVKQTLGRIASTALGVGDPPDEPAATIPFAVCVAFGVTLAGLHHLLGVAVPVMG